MARGGSKPGERRGGRPKGAVNKDKRELLARIQEKCPGYDPVVAMAMIATDAENALELRFQAHKEVAQYVTPKLKSVEHRGDIAGDLVIRWATE